MGNVVEVIKLTNGRYAKPCPTCGEIQDYLRRNYAEASLREGKEYKKCAQANPAKNTVMIYRGIRLSWLKKFETNARLRGLDWEIGADIVADLYEAQGAKCALTGWDITFPETGHAQLSSASIDRVDSQFGYLPENIQLVDKRVNMMKQQYSQDEFIAVCLAVANREKW